MRSSRPASEPPSVGSIADGADGLGAVLALPPDAIATAGQGDGAVLVVDDGGLVREDLEVERGAVSVEPGRARALDAVTVPGDLALGEEAVRRRFPPRRDGPHRRDEDVSLSPHERDLLLERPSTRLFWGEGETDKRRLPWLRGGYHVGRWAGTIGGRSLPARTPAG